jgi:hypothetical protein
VKGLEIRIEHDAAILEGRIRRLEIRAASALVGEFKRRDAALLRVRDVRLALEDLVRESYGARTLNISPQSIYTGALGAALFALRMVTA